MNKYEEALGWLTWRCMEPNDDYEGLVYDYVPDFEIETNIEPLRKLIEKTKPKKENKRKTRLMLNIEKYIIASGHSEITCCVNDLLHLECSGDCEECKKKML